MPDGRAPFPGSDDRTPQIWDLESSQALRTLKGHRASLWAVAVMAVGHRGISGSDDRTLRVFRLLRSGSRVRNSFSDGCDVTVKARADLTKTKKSQVTFAAFNSTKITPV
jgi:WD40 repeat protein